MMYSPIKAVDHSKNIVRLNSIERELFQRRTRSMRWQLETCQETFSSSQHKQHSKSDGPKSKIEHPGKIKLEKVCRTESEVIHRVSGGDGKHKKNCKNQMPSDCDNYGHRSSHRHELKLKYGSNRNHNYCGAGEYDCKAVVAHPEKIECAHSEQIGCGKPILNKLRRPPHPPVFCSPSARPKSKRFTSASPSTSLDQFLVPTKPNSPKKHKRSRLLQNCQIRLEPGPNSNPARSLDISKYKCLQTFSVPDQRNDIDSTQHRIKEFLDKTCADAARSRTKIGPAVSLSDLAAIDEQQTSMPILVEGVLAPEERKRQVSKVYPMRTPSPLHASHLFGAGGLSTRSNSRVTRNEHPGRLGSPLNLPPIILPPICENKEFQPRHCSWSSSVYGEEDQPLSKPMTEEDWRSLRKCRYLRIPQSAEQVSFMDNVESVFK